MRFPDRHVPELVKTKLVPTELPETMLWANVSGVNYLTVTKQQHIPQYCGSCWAQAATSALSDRIKIMRKAQWPDINIAPQPLVSCIDYGCDGSWSLSAYEWIKNNNITDETCSVYQARGISNGLECSPIIKCKNCSPGSDKCEVPESYLVYTVEEYGSVYGEENMQQQILQHGPISCGIAVTEALLNYTGGVFED
jgi:cathepsin X